MVDKSIKNWNLAIVVSHPIQHFCPQYHSFSKMSNVKLKVFFASAVGFKKYYDKDFGQNVNWNNLYLDGFEHLFLNGDDPVPIDANLEAPTLLNELNKFNPNAIITYGYFQKFQRVCHRWANENKIPLAYISDAENRQKRPILKRIIKFFYLRWYFRKIDFFLTVGNANEEYYKHYGVNSAKCIRMHFPIDIKTYEKAFNERYILNQKIREKNNISSDTFIISVVGKLVSWKNQSHLIDLLRRLEEEGYSAHVFILGSGPELAKIKEKANVLKQNVVHLPGFVSPTELPMYYAASDLYIHPAEIEPHSLAISEAIYMGCPVILSDRCGSSGETDDVQIGRNGFTYPFGDIESLLQKVLVLMNNAEMRKNFSEYSINISRSFQNRSHGDSVIELHNKIDK